jgi:hypothetical protein
VPRAAPPTPAPPKPVFVDLRGRRKWWVRAAGALLALACVALLTVTGLVLDDHPTTPTPAVSALPAPAGPAAPATARGARS